MKNKLLLFLIGVFFLLTLPGCPTEPVDDGKPTPPDTTSHNFIWQKFILGGDASSSLRDVAIVNDTSIWAVGEIYLKDSTGQSDPEAYSLALWNGKEWKLMKLYDTKNNLISNIRGVLAFDATNIWLADGGIHHWDGVSRNVDESFDRISLIGGSENYQSVNKLFGISSDNIYGVGYKGMIVHYQNGQWNKIESGIDLNINDVWGGTYNNATTILAAASNLSTNNAKKLLRIRNDIVDTLEWTPQTTLYTIWFKNLDKIYAGGDGLYVNNEMEWKRQDELPNDFVFRIRGEEENNIFVTGGFGFTAHFNGRTWKVLEEVSLQSGNYESLDVKGNVVALVGFEGNAAVVTLGRSQ